MQSLQEIQSTLQVALENEALISLITTRVALRTGVDLKAIQPGDNTDVAQVKKVVEALSALGFSPATLEVVAKRKTGK